MIYKISNKYYVNISPMIFSEVSMVVIDDKVVIKPTGKKIEVNANTEVIATNLADEKVKILEDHKKKHINTMEYRPSKNRRK